MRKSVAATFLALSALAMQTVSAQAADVSVTATITGADIGTRTLQVPGSIALVTTSGQSQLSGSFATVVAESAKQGANPWSVTASVTDFSGPNSSTITKDKLTVGTRSTVQVLGGGSLSYTAADGSSFGTTRELVKNAGQSSSVAYTGTYTTTNPLALEIPNGSATGAYSATMTLTLVQ
ncbi:MAG TPA: hypothetical protein VM143_12925 [Acidimicrobiales bacterium]|nr:hypothetical protein [Acidimicrobiales bacterium]